MYFAYLMEDGEAKNMKETLSESWLWQIENVMPRILDGSLQLFGNHLHKAPKWGRDEKKSISGSNVIARLAHWKIY